MGINARLARAVKVPIAWVDSLGIPEGVRVFAAVAAVIGLATYQVVYGKSKGQTLSQEKPDVLVYARGPRSVEQEKAALEAAAAAAAPAAAAPAALR